MENELYHYGRKGMKWYQKIFTKQGAAVRKKERAAKEAEAKKRSKEEYEADKAKAVKSGSAKDILKFKGDLTPEQMSYALNRIRWEQDMGKISDSEISAGQKKANKFFGGLDNVTEKTVSALKAYNTFANIYNAFTGTDKKQLPTIRTDNTKDNREERKKEEKSSKQKESASSPDPKPKSASTKNKDAASESSSSKGAGSVFSRFFGKSKSSDSGSSGDVFGKGTSKKSSSNKSEVFDAIFEDIGEDIPVRAMASEFISIGQAHATRLLEPPR